MRDEISGYARRSFRPSNDNGVQLRLPEGGASGDRGRPTAATPGSAAASVDRIYPPSEFGFASLQRFIAAVSMEQSSMSEYFSFRKS